MFLSSYRITSESLGEIEKAFETLAITPYKQGTCFGFLKYRKSLKFMKIHLIPKWQPL